MEEKNNEVKVDTRDWYLKDVKKRYRQGKIYIIRNLKTKKKYIGQTRHTLKERWKWHMDALEKDENGRRELYKAMKEYGIDNFWIDLLEDEIPIKNLDKKEVEYIIKHNSYYNGYNMTKGGERTFKHKYFDVDVMYGFYKEGKSVEELSDYYGVSLEEINSLIKMKEEEVN